MDKRSESQGGQHTLKIAVYLYPECLCCSCLQYRAMRRWEQDRLARMDEDFKKKVAEAEFEKRRLERLAASEEKTLKKRAKRQKMKEMKKAKKGTSGDKVPKEDGHSDSEGEENEHIERVQELQKTLD